MDEDWHDVMRRSTSSRSESDDDEREQFANMILSMHIPSAHELHELNEIKGFKVLKCFQEDDVKVIVMLCLVVVYWNILQNLKGANVFKQNTTDLR